MKQKHLIATAIVAATLTPSANAASLHTYANTLAGHNITTIQHSITQNIFNKFQGAAKNQLQTHNTTQHPQQNLYGTMSIYGEYNDDGNAGRNGGDTARPDTILNSTWFDWQHVNDNTHYKNLSDTDANFNTFTMGLAGGQTKLGNGESKWGIYTGFLNTKQSNAHTVTKGQGGYFGVYNGFTQNNFNLSTTINGGVIDNSSDNHFGTDEFTNFWIGGALNARLNIMLDNTFMLQPMLHAGYTWIKSENYTSASGDKLQNDAFNTLEFTPGIRAIKHIANDWYGTLNAKYVMIFLDGGELHINNNAANSLEIGNFFEYSISVEKDIQNFNLSALIGRHEGERDGWIGSLNIKYIF